MKLFKISSVNARTYIPQSYEFDCLGTSFNASILKVWELEVGFTKKLQFFAIALAYGDMLEFAESK